MVETTTALEARALTISDLALQRNLLAASRIFDESSYFDRAGDGARLDPIGHYLEIGWRQGLEPVGSFPGTFLLPYFATLGITGPPAITWLLLRSAGWPVYDSRADIECAANLVRNSALFNEAFYRVQMGPRSEGLDPAVHYVTVGEFMGFSPSLDFDPVYYSARNPDVGRASVGRLIHYISWGRTEGRFSKPAEVRKVGKVGFDPDRENIILVIHETTRTGAPIHGWNIAVHLARTYNLFTVHLGDGELTPAFEELSVERYGPFPPERRNEVDIEYSLRSMLNARGYRYAVINSTASRLLIEPCARRFIPTLLLVHEFASYIFPSYSLHTALDLATEIIFPAEVVGQSAKEFHPALCGRSLHYMPQGLVKAPPAEGSPQLDAAADTTLAELTYKHDQQGVFIVLGAGALELRKGVELFLAAAASIVRRNPALLIHFVWVGAGYRPREDFHYSVYLHEQILRSGLQDHVTFLDALPSLEPVYGIADAFLLSSRLDPFPNVTIESAFHGIPVIAFRNASGIADMMQKTQATASTVVDYADAEGAADVLIRLASDPEFRQNVAGALREMVSTKLDMQGYDARLDAIGRAARARTMQQAADIETLRNDSTFDQDMFLGPKEIVETRDETITRYVCLRTDCESDTVSQHYHFYRRPAAGFNPRIYAEAHQSQLRGGVNPLADFVRRDKPEGPWQSSVIFPPAVGQSVAPKGTLRVAIHAHFYYPELHQDFIRRLAYNTAAFDLLISTDTQAKAGILHRAFSNLHEDQVHIRVMPNQGRDVGPLLTGFSPELGRYDLIGHVHGKRSPYTGHHAMGSLWGESWRDFLWQNLLGGLHPMMDRIVSAFEDHGSLGLVFPSDPNLCGWDENRELASELAARMGWSGPLPNHFEFPVGTMFWARVAALRPLLGLRVGWEDYPPEPVARDGTLLHALERLMVFACQLSGFHYAVTHVPGVSWIPPV